MSSDPRLDALRSLADTGLKLARGTTSARLAVAGLRDLVDPAALPPEVRDRVVAELDKAHAQATTPMSLKEVEKALKDAWGEKPATVLDSLEEEPVACTPSSQVHRGVHDGSPVAVKVLRPGLAEAVRNDLNLLDALIRPIGGVFPALRPGELLREVRERTLDELDLEHEASTQRSFARALRRNEALHVPAPVSDLCHERVLVTAWVDGAPIAELTDAGQRSTAARGLIAFHVGSARFGTVHADPHPGNAILMEDGRLAILDFGAVRRVPAERVDEALVALGAFLAGEGDALGASLGRLGWLPAEVGSSALVLGRELLDGHLDGPSRIDARTVVATGERAYAHLEAIWPLAQVASPPPEDLWPLRMLGSLALVLARLEVEEDWPALIAAAARDGF